MRCKSSAAVKHNPDVYPNKLKYLNALINNWDCQRYGCSQLIHTQHLLLSRWSNNHLHCWHTKEQHTALSTLPTTQPTGCYMPHCIAQNPNDCDTKKHLVKLLQVNMLTQ